MRLGQSVPQCLIVADYLSSPIFPFQISVRQRVIVFGMARAICHSLMNSLILFEYLLMDSVIDHGSFRAIYGSQTEDGLDLAWCSGLIVLLEKQLPVASKFIGRGLDKFDRSWSCGCKQFMPLMCCSC